MIQSANSSFDPPVRVMALHALLYCERLFYLEEVEEIRVADANVYAGRRLHVERVPLDDESPELRSFEVSSDHWGLLGKVDAVRKRDGAWIAYEHKRGRCRKGDNGEIFAWPSDRIQAIAYSVLIEEELGEPVREARVRYHADHATARIPIDEQARQDLRQAVNRAISLRQSTTRPPVTENERLCTGCSLALVCLPEEERLQSSPPEHQSAPILTRTVKSGPKIPTQRERHTLHVVAQKAYISRSSDTLVVKTDDEKQTVPVAQVDAVIIHGHGQVTTQAIHLCSQRGIPIQWMTYGGRFLAGTTNTPGRVQQRIRQFTALGSPEICLGLAQRTTQTKVESQLGYLLRSTRDNMNVRQAVEEPISRIRESLKRLGSVTNLDSLRGLEGMAAKAYFAAVPKLISPRIDTRLLPQGRSKHPPKDCFNAILSFGYGMLFALVHRTVISVGLEPAFGYFHQPRSAAPPLVLDIMEIFRVSLVDMPTIGSLNRGQWNVDEDFTHAGTHVWLSDSGRKKAITLFEQRLTESSKHPYTGSSMTYSRIVELEVRLLEKEWTGCPGLFARMKIR